MAKSRYTDPATSSDAARLVEGSGTAARHRDKLYRTICFVHPNEKTAGELAFLTGIERHEVSRRLPELRPLLVENGEARRCQFLKTFAITWRRKQVDKDPQIQLFKEGQV